MRRTHLLAASVLTAAVASAAPAATAGDAPRASASATTIRVTGGEYYFRLSSKSARHGRVTFRFTNKGTLKHDFKIAGKKSRLIRKGRSTSISVTLRKGSYRYVCTVSGHAAAGMKGRFRVR
jgi:plastocyanin